jgi:eukaryotic-like serine/threonine-protein kinase
MIDAVAQYRILERLGVRALGEVYRARDRHGRTMLLLVVDPAITADASRRDRFVRDAQAAHALLHPNIAALVDIVEDGDRLCLVFEFVPGEPLVSAMGGRAMNVRRALDLGAQMADALAEAHAAGLVHGGLTPAAVVVTPKGAAKLLAAGLAAVPAATSAYASPEQAAGCAFDARSDIFALGVVLFEMVTGRLPFHEARAIGATTPAADAAPRPTAINPALPRELDGVVAKALATNPDDRYASAAVVAAKLRAIAEILEARRAATER